MNVIITIFCEYYELNYYFIEKQTKRNHNVNTKSYVYL